MSYRLRGMALAIALASLCGSPAFAATVPYYTQPQSGIQVPADGVAVLNTDGTAVGPSNPLPVTSADITAATATPGNDATKAVAVQGVTGGKAVATAPVAGTNIIGKVGIDQTTPGTTNGVQVNSSALPTGAATAASQTSVQATDGTANAAGTVGLKLVLKDSGGNWKTAGSAGGALSVAGGQNAGGGISGTFPVGIAASDGSLTRWVASDTSGNLTVSAIPTANAGISPSSQQCTVACASTIVSGAHNLYGLTFSATVTGWLLLEDATSCAANGTVTPIRAYAYTTANTTMTVSWGTLPKSFATGLAACFSSTGPYSATASTTAFIAVDYK